MKHEIALYRSLTMDASQVYPALRAVLDAIMQEKAPYQRTTLTVAFEGLGPPFGGRVSVPVHLKARHDALRYESEITIVGAAAGGVFPTFTGTLRVNPLGDQGCEIWLDGDYAPPLAGLGEIIDRTLLNNAARASLARMLEWLVGEVSRCAKAS